MNARSPSSFSLLLCFIAILFSGSSSAGLKVVVSIMPIHSLVCGLMSGIGQPYLLLKGNQSPHTMTLKPSDMRAISQADLLLWVGESLESPLARVVEKGMISGRVVSLLDTPNLHLLPVRNDLEWSHHDHSNHEDSDHAHDEHNWDSHIWLSPENARTIADHLAQQLIRLDPEHTTDYQTNLQNLLQRIDRLEMAFRTNINEVKEQPFIVFHDAYRYLENHFDLKAVGSVSVSPERQSGAKHIHKLRQKIRRLEAICVFSEPQFEPKLVATLIAGTEASAGILDPLGMALTPGEDAYFQLMNALSENFASCLGGKK
ncbi:MAG: zinc ABC transporter substrate-binding protein [Candidatus Thiodiazotropha sp.]|jgi:zinc transport system substrate-binding protein